jgi:hypothetical protein
MIVGALDDANKQVRITAARVLPEFDREKAYADLLKIIKDPGFSKKDVDEQEGLYVALGATNMPGAGQMQYARALIESRPFLTRVPDQSLLTSDPGKGTDRVQATRGEDGSFAFVYSASGQPLFQGRRSTRRTGSPSSLPRRTIARRFSAAAATERPWAMSLIPPCTTSMSAPTAHSSRRAMISSVRWPWIPQLRNSSRVSACAAQCSHWLVSSPPLRES